MRILVMVGEQVCSIKVDSLFLGKTEMSEEELWVAAYADARKNIKIYTMAEALGLPPELTVGLPFFVCTRADRTDGATALAYPEIFREFCEENGLEAVYLIPSSVEELILFGDMSVSPKDLANMVAEVNCNVVDPVLQLEPVVYRYDLDINKITIAAEYWKED